MNKFTIIFLKLLNRLQIYGLNKAALFLAIGGLPRLGYCPMGVSSYFALSGIVVRRKLTAKQIPGLQIKFKIWRREVFTQF